MPPTCIQHVYELRKGSGFLKSHTRPIDTTSTMQGRLFLRFQEVKATVLGRRHDTTFTWSPTNYMAFRPGGLSRRFSSSQISASAYSLGPYWRTMPLESRLAHDNGLGTLSAMLNTLNFIFETTFEGGAVHPPEVAHLSMSGPLQDIPNPTTSTALVSSYSRVMQKMYADFPGVRLELLPSSSEAERLLTTIAGNIQMSLYSEPMFSRNTGDDPNYRGSLQQASHARFSDGLEAILNPRPSFSCPCLDDGKAVIPEASQAGFSNTTNTPILAHSPDVISAAPASAYTPSKPSPSSFTLPSFVTAPRPLSLTTSPVVHATRMTTAPMRPRSAAFGTSARQTVEGSPPISKSCQASQEASPTRSVDLSQMANRRFIPLVLYVQRTGYLSPYIKIQSIVRHYREEEPSVFGVETPCIEEAVATAVRLGLLTQVDEKRVKCVEGVSYCFRDVTNTSAAPSSKLSTHIPVIDMTWDVHRPYQPLLDYILLAMSIGPQMCIRTIVRHFQQEEPTIYGHEEQQIRIAISTAVQLGLLTQVKRERVKCVDGMMYKFEGDVVR